MKKPKGKGRRPPELTPEAITLGKAIKAAGVSQAQVAEAARLNSDRQISHWVTGVRPLPADHARAVGDYLGVDPKTISAAYRDLVQREPGSVLAMPGESVMRPDLVQNRNENDVESLRWFGTLLVDVMFRHQPAAAVDLLDTIQKRAPKKFRDNGFLLELSEEMAQRVAASAKAPVVARPRAKRRAS